MKTWCIAVHLLQQSLVEVVDDLLSLTGTKLVPSLLECLEKSIDVSYTARSDDIVSEAFQHALRQEWGDGVVVDDSPESRSRINLMFGSAKFFLAQEASSTCALLHSLSILHGSGAIEDENVAEQPLIRIMEQVLTKFLDSEEKDADLIERIDPNVWRTCAIPISSSAVCKRGDVVDASISNGNGSVGKMALFCTTFARTVVDTCRILTQFSSAQFARHRTSFLPLLLALIRVECHEIRMALQSTLIKHLKP